MKGVAISIILSAAVAGFTSRVAAESWTYCGKAIFHDGLIVDMIDGMEPYVFEVDIEADADNSGKFRIVDPYSQENPCYRLFSSFCPVRDSDDHRYIVIDATDKNNVIIEKSPLGIYINDEEIFVHSYTFIENNDYIITSEFIDFNELRGVVQDNAIVFSTPNAFILSYPSLYAVSHGTLPNNKDGSFMIELPEMNDNPGDDEDNPSDPPADTDDPSGDDPSDESENDGIVDVEITGERLCRYFDLKGCPIHYPSPGKIYIRIDGNNRPSLVKSPSRL